MISVRFQGKPFNITVIHVYTPTNNAEEAVSWMVLWRATTTSRTSNQKRCRFHYRGLECKSKFLWFLLSILPSLLNVNISIGYAFRFTDLDSTKCNVSFIPKFHYFFISLIIIFIAGKSIWVSYNLFNNSLNTDHIPNIFTCLVIF